jgi:hypothetical protein
VYAAFVIDVLSRMVVGWQVATSLYTELALDRRPGDGYMETPPHRRRPRSCLESGSRVR